MKRKSNILVLMFFLSACTDGLRKDDQVARVNGLVITVRDFQSVYENIKPKDLPSSGREAAEIKNLALKNLIRRFVILSEAQKSKITVPESELEASINQLKRGYTPDIFHEALLESMVDENEWRQQVEQNILISKIFDATNLPKPQPKKEEALDFYEKNSSLFRLKARAIALQIVVADKNLAQELRKKISANPKEFVALSKKNSIGPEALLDSKIEIEKGVLPPELDRVLFESPINALSPVIESPYGFHIICVLERIPSLNKDFEQAKSDIFKRLQFEQRAAGLARFEEDLIRAAQIEYNRALIKRL